MKEKKIIKLCIIISLLGLVMLYLYTDNYDLKTIKYLEESDINKVVNIQGKVSEISQQEKIAFIEIENEKVEITKVVLFKDEDIWLKKGDYVSITGSVEEYQGEKEIIGNKVVVKRR